MIPRNPLSARLSLGLIDGSIICSKKIDWISLITIPKERVLEEISRLLLSGNGPLLDFFFGPPEMLVLLVRSQNAPGGRQM